MGLLDSILGAASGEGGASGQANPLIGIVGGLLAQSGGLQGLANKFAQSGHGNAFQSWVGMGENQPVSSNQIQNVLGSEQVNAIATRMGVDPRCHNAWDAKDRRQLRAVGKIDPAGRPSATISDIAAVARKVGCADGAGHGLGARHGEHLYNEHIRRQ